jgi:hypothetical protein
MHKKCLKGFWAFNLLALILACGCNSIKIDSNKDAKAVHKVNRLFIVINQGAVKTQPFSTALADGLKSCFTNATPQIEIAITSPLDLDENNYKSKMESFNADGVLAVSLQTYETDEYGNYPMIIYDASLYDPLLKKRVWRASIKNGGQSFVMASRMRAMASSIVAKLKTDGFIEPN